MKRQIRHKIEPVPTIVELFKLMEEHQQAHPEYERYNFKYIEDGDAIGAIAAVSGGADHGLYVFVA